MTKTVKSRTAHFLAETAQVDAAAVAPLPGSRKVYVEGSIRTRKWQGQDGQDRYTTEIVANEMQMLDGRGGGGDGGGYQNQGGGQPTGYENQDYDYGQQGGGDQRAKPAGGQQGGGFSGPADDFDDDIPF